MRAQLYRHFDNDGKLLYVGISLNAVKRLAQHKIHAHWFESISQIKIESFETREAAVLAERNAISNENPIHNLMRPSIKPHPLSSKERMEASIRDLTKRIVQFNTTYSIRDVASSLGTSETEVKRFMDENKLAFIEVPWRIGAPTRRRVTGWQLIDFIEFLESDSQEKRAM